MEGTGSPVTGGALQDFRRPVRCDVGLGRHPVELGRQTGDRCGVNAVQATTARRDVMHLTSPSHIEQTAVVRSDEDVVERRLVMHKAKHLAACRSM